MCLYCILRHVVPSWLHNQNWTGLGALEPWRIVIFDVNNGVLAHLIAFTSVSVDLFAPGCIGFRFAWVEKCTC